jgi:hypothetical protein
MKKGQKRKALKSVTETSYEPSPKDKCTTCEETSPALIPDDLEKLILHELNLMPLEAGMKEAMSLRSNSFTKIMCEMCSHSDEKGSYTYLSFFTPDARKGEDFRIVCSCCTKTLSKFMTQFDNYGTTNRFILQTKWLSVNDTYEFGYLEESDKKETEKFLRMANDLQRSDAILDIRSEFNTINERLDDIRCPI